MDPKPTPFDIRPIPHFAFSPSLQTWLIVGVCLTAVYALALIISKLSKRKGTLLSNACSVARAELRQINTPFTKEKIVRISLIIRRLLAVKLPHTKNSITITEMVGSELQAYVSTLKGGPAHSLLEQILVLEQFKYQPQEIIELPESEITQIIRLIEALEAEEKPR